MIVSLHADACCLLLLHSRSRFYAAFCVYSLYTITCHLQATVFCSYSTHAYFIITCLSPQGFREGESTVIIQTDTQAYTYLIASM